MSLILSTKILPAALRRHIFAADIGLVEYDAVKIESTAISFSNKFVENAIFTSQNAVKLAFEKHQLKFQHVFCVGQKTADLLKSYGLRPNLVAENAKDLALLLLKENPNKAFDFFCSAQRRDELPKLLKTNNIDLYEHYLYQSVANSQYFKNNFDAILCFSPLGVKAYYEHHDKQPLAICIGETTAEAAKKFTSEVLVAKKSSLESVVYKSIITLK